MCMLTLSFLLGLTFRLVATESFEDLGHIASQIDPQPSARGAPRPPLAPPTAPPSSPSQPPPSRPPRLPAPPPPQPPPPSPSLTYASPLLQPPPLCLVLTGVFAGPLPGGLPKGVELYVSCDVPDLSLYALESAIIGAGGTRGKGWNKLSMNPKGWAASPASLSAGSFVYVSKETERFEAFFGFAPTVIASSAMDIDGDDAIRLYLINSLTRTVIDTFGDFSTDDTSERWKYQDGWASRRGGTGPDGTSFQLASWTLGKGESKDSATNADAMSPMPVGQYSAPQPTPSAPPSPSRPPLITSLTPRPPTPSPSPAPPPPPSPPACQVRLQNQGQCKDQGADKNNCHKYFYKNDTESSPPAWKQCRWKNNACWPNGFKCDPDQRGAASCSCPARCPWVVEPDRCGEQGATKDTCTDYFYEKQNGDWRQCIWAIDACRAGGFSCEVSSKEWAGCNCPATCPTKLPFLVEAVGTNCKDQNASMSNCARCAPRHYILNTVMYYLTLYLHTRYAPPVTSTRPS